MDKPLIPEFLMNYIDSLVPPRLPEMQAMEDYAESLPVIAEKLRPGGVLIVDNMLWHGRIFDGEDKITATESIRKLTGLLTRSPDWIASLVPVRDGVMLAYKV